jgi:hypothetical protein
VSAAQLKKKGTRHWLKANAWVPPTYLARPASRITLNADARVTPT